MNGIKRILFVLLLTGLAFPVCAQEHAEHAHPRNEIGLSGGAIYSFDHKAWGGGLHLHYFRTLGPHSKWSVGGMVEEVWLHGGHFSIGAGAKFEPFPRFSIGLLPGVTFLRHDGDADHDDHGHTSRKALFSTHIELVYDLFHWKKFHLGPAVDFSVSSGDSHAMIGVHGAYAF